MTRNNLAIILDKIYANYVDYSIPSTTEVVRKMRCRGVMWDRGIFYSLYVPLNSHLFVLIQAKLI